jgi:hypothetical protein
VVSFWHAEFSGGEIILFDRAKFSGARSQGTPGLRGRTAQTRTRHFSRGR